MIARGYIRVSTDEQAKNGASIPSQEKILRALAVVKGYDDFDVYIDDGFSGKNLRRPRVQQLLEECRAGRVDAVIVWKLDRLSRSLRDLLNLIEEDFTPHGVTLISATESIDTSTPGGRAMLAVLGTFAQFEREQDAERVTMVHRQLAKDCRYLGGPVPLGYKIVNKYYEVDEATAPVVRCLFDMYLAHQGYTEMLRYLNGTGLKTATGKPFAKTNLNYILSNEKYVGTYIHNRLAAADHEGKRSSSRLKPEADQIRIPGGIPAIIDQATWDAACRLRAENRATRGTYTSTPYLLAGRCHCAVCGSALRVLTGGTDRNGTRQRYYTCPRRCIPLVRKERLEDAAFDAIANASLDEDMLIRACDVANSFLAAQDEDAAADIHQMKQRMAEISKRQANITDALASSGAAAPSYLLQELTTLDADKAALASRLTQLQHRGPHYDPRAILHQLNTVKTAKEKPPEQQKSILQATIRDAIISQGDYSFILTADESVELTRALRPDVVLMDVQMETMTAGIDAMEIIHREYPQIKCVTLSIHQNDEYMLRAYLVGACAYIVKTSTPEEIVRSIDHVMKNTLQLQPEVAAKIIQEYQRMKQDESIIKDILRVVMKISASEYEILRLVYDGYTYKAIAEQRFVQETTIRSQVNHILKKFEKKRMRNVIRMLKEVSFFDKLG